MDRLLIIYYLFFIFWFQCCY